MRTLICLGLTLGAALTSASAFGQSCSSPVSVGANGGEFTVDTCKSTNQLTDLCNGSLPVPGPDVAYAITLESNVKATFSAAPKGYDASLFLLSAECSASSTCSKSAESAGSGKTEVLESQEYPAGKYFLVVDSFAATGNCGPTTITISPLNKVVALQEIDVK